MMLTHSSASMTHCSTLLSMPPHHTPCLPSIPYCCVPVLLSLVTCALQTGQELDVLCSQYPTHCVWNLCPHLSLDILCPVSSPHRHTVQVTCSISSPATCVSISNMAGSILISTSPPAHFTACLILVRRLAFCSTF